MKFACALSAVALSAAMLPAEAQTVAQNAPGMCSPASGVDERGLRRDAMHLINVSKKPISVVCSMGNEGFFTRLHVMLINVSGNSVPVTCILTPARAEFNIGWASVVETVNATFSEGGFNYTNVLFDFSDNADGNYFEAANWSCTLPPGIGIGAAWTDRVGQ